MPDLPAALLIDDRAAAALAGISRATWRRLMAAGKIGPTAVRLGRAVRWNRCEVECWIAQGCADARTWRAMESMRRARAM